MPPKNTSRNRERTGGLGSEEQYEKLGQIVQQGLDITPEAAANLSTHITAPSFTQGPGRHDPNNVKTPKSSLQQLNEFATGGLAPLLKAQNRSETALKNSRIASDSSALDETSLTIAGWETKWEKSINKTFKERTEQGKNYLSPERLNEVTEIDKDTGVERINWDLLTNAEKFSISTGTDLTGLAGKSPKEIAALLDNLPIEQNRGEQRKKILEELDKLKDTLKTTEGRVAYYKNRNSLNNYMKELTADEYRANMLQIVSLLDSDPNIAAPEAQIILDNWAEGIYLNNPKLARSGLFQQTIQTIIDTGMRTIAQTRATGITKWANDLDTSGVFDILGSKIMEHFINGSLIVPDDATWTIENIPPSVIVDFMISTVLGTKEDDPAIFSPKIIEEISKGLNITVPEGFDKESDVTRAYLEQLLYPRISKRLTDVQQMHQNTRDLSSLEMSLDAINHPYANDGSIKPLDLANTFPSQGTQDERIYFEKLKLFHKQLEEGIIQSAVVIATNQDPDITIGNRLDDGLSRLSEENFNSLYSEYHTRKGTFISEPDAAKRTENINTEAAVARKTALSNFWIQVADTERQDAMLRLDADLLAAAVTNNLDEEPIEQFYKSVQNMDYLMDNIVKVERAQANFERTGEATLPTNISFVHPILLDEDEKEDIPEELRDSFWGLIKEEWEDIMGGKKNRYSVVDPSSPTGKTVTEIFEKVRSKYATDYTSTGSRRARNIDGDRSSVSDQNDAADSIVNSIRITEKALANAPEDDMDNPGVIKDLTDKLAEADHIGWLGIIELIPNIEEHWELSSGYIQDLERAMSKPEAFYKLSLPFYLTDDTGKYYISEGARASVISTLINSEDHKELGYLLQYLDNELTISSGSLPTDPDERALALAETSTFFHPRKDLAALIEMGKAHAKKQIEIEGKDLSGALDKLLKNPDAYDDDEFPINYLIDEVFLQLGTGGYLTQSELIHTPGSIMPSSFDLGFDPSFRLSEDSPESLAEVIQILDPESTRAFMLEMVSNYVADYQLGGLTDDEGERKDYPLKNWVATQLNQQIGTEGWGTFVDNSLGKIYFIKDPKRYMTGDVPAFTAIMNVASKMPIIDNSNHNSLEMTYVTKDQLNNNESLDALEKGLDDTLAWYYIKDPTFLFEDNTFFKDNNIWIADKNILEFRNLTEDMKLSGDYANRHTDPEYNRVVNNIKASINNGVLKIPGALDPNTGEWIMHPVYDTPSAVQLDTSSYTYRDAVSDWIDITGGFPTQNFYSLIGNDIQTRADVYIMAIDTQRSMLDNISNYAKAEPITLDRIHAIPSIDLTGAELGTYRNTPSFRAPKNGEDSAKYERARHIFNQTTLRNFKQNRNGYPVHMAITDPSSKNPQLMPPSFRKNVRYLNGKWTITSTSEPVFMVNQHKVEQITRDKLQDNPDKRWRLNNRDMPTDTLSLYIPPKVSTSMRGELEIKAVDLPDKASYRHIGKHGNIKIQWDWEPINHRESPFFRIKTNAGYYILPVTFSETTRQLLKTDLQ